MVNIGNTAGTAMGILGMGIGLTLLAKTAKDISEINTRTMRGRSYKPRYKPARRSYRPRSSSIRMRNISYKPQYRKF